MVEGARLLSEYTVKSRIEGSNPFLSAIFTLPFDTGAPANRLDCGSVEPVDETTALSGTGISAASEGLSLPIRFPYKIAH